MDIDAHSPQDKPGAKVVIVTHLTRNVVESHLKTVFGFYGQINKIDLPVFGKCAFGYLHDVLRSYVDLYS